MQIALSSLSSYLPCSSLNRAVDQIKKTVYAITSKVKAIALVIFSLKTIVFSYTIWQYRRTYDRFKVVPPATMLDLKIEDAAACYFSMVSTIATTPYFKCWKELHQFKESLDGQIQLATKWIEGFERGTCLGQTMSLLHQLPRNHKQNCKELLESIIKTEELLFQTLNCIRVELYNWLAVQVRERSAKISTGGGEEIDLSKIGSVLHAVERLENDILHYSEDVKYLESCAVWQPEMASSQFVSQIKAQLTRLQSQEPKAILAANLVVTCKGNSGHSLFVQFSGSHFRFYNSNHGFYEFPTLDALLQGLYDHLHFLKKETSTIQAAYSRFYAITG